jgi:hypothetical protein
MRTAALRDGMPDRRRFLQVCAATATGVVTGCFGGVDGDRTDPGTHTATGTPADSTTDDDVLYDRAWSGVTIEKESGWIREVPEFDESNDLTYTVTVAEPVPFDVYVFNRENTKETYERWINAPSGMKFETNGIVGLSGATARNVSESIERTAFVDGGRKWVAVDYSDFNGGFPRAEVDGDSPEEITLDVSIRATAAF